MATFSLAVRKSAYISLIIGPRGLVCEANLYEIMGWESFDMVRSDLGPLLQGQTRIAKLKSAFITRLLLVVEVWVGKSTYRKSWPGNLLVWSDLTFGPRLQGQMRIAKPKSAYNSLIIGPTGWQCETNL